MTVGITILVVGNPTYMRYASNMMLSFKKNSGLPVQLICEKHLIEYIEPYERNYNILTEIEKEDCYIDERLNPGKAKVNLYKYFHWDETIYLDVDGIILKEVEPLLEFDGYYKTQKDAMHWASDDKIREHFKLSKEFPIHGLNSSLQCIRKCPEAEKIFSDAALAMKNPFPQDQQDNNWFGWYPDELYLSIGIGKSGIDPYFEPPYPIFFRPRSTYGAYNRLVDVVEGHYAIGCYGGDRYNHLSVIKMYDNCLHKWSGELFKRNMKYKFDYLMNSKHDR